VDLEKNGLMSALSELAESSSHLYRIECRFHCERPVLVTNDATATHLYRIAQEAISNAVRHARAKTISLALRPAGDDAVLTITNNGAPLPAEPGRSGGMGLRIMQYRAELIGATLRLGSTADGTTELSCTFKPH
jgi:signal transduction histidine kinase